MMNIVDGDYVGGKCRIKEASHVGPILEVSSGFKGTTKYNFADGVSSAMLLKKETEKLNSTQTSLLILISATGIGALFAIALFILWQRVCFTMGIETRDGKRFLVTGQHQDWVKLQRLMTKGGFQMLDTKHIPIRATS